MVSLQLNNSIYFSSYLHSQSYLVHPKHPSTYRMTHFHLKLTATRCSITARSLTQFNSSSICSKESDFIRRNVRDEHFFLSPLTFLSRKLFPLRPRSRKKSNFPFRFCNLLSHRKLLQTSYDNITCMLRRRRSRKVFLFAYTIVDKPESSMDMRNCCS